MPTGGRRRPSRGCARASCRSSHLRSWRLTASRCRAYVAMYSGLAMYMLRPPTSRGMPALGCARASPRRGRPSARSRRGSSAGPTEQLSPMMSAPKRSSARATSCGRHAVRCQPIDADRHLRDDRHPRIDVARGVDRLLHLIEIGERLDDEAVGAARRPAPPSARETSRAPRRGSSDRTARCEAPSGPTAPATSRCSPADVAGQLARHARLSSRDLRLETVLGELRAIGAEAVGLQHFGARAARTRRARRGPAPARGRSAHRSTD